MAIAAHTQLNQTADSVIAQRVLHLVGKEQLLKLDIELKLGAREPES